MEISLIDRSLYLKGLMLLIRKDGEIQDEEKNMMLCAGEMLGFDKGFCEDTIEEILHNKHIVDEPPLFSSTGIARSFVRDGLRIALTDGRAHESELQWLKAVADVNGIQDDVLRGLVATMSSSKGSEKREV